MAQHARLGKESAFFDSATFSDVTVLIGDERIYAHKIILAAHSGFFRKAFTSGFKEGANNEIRLHDDDPRAARGIIAWCYGLTYDGKGEYDEAQHGYERPIFPDYVGVYAIYLINLHAAADKYDIHDLATSIRREWQYQLDDVKDAFDPYWLQLAAILQHLYSDMAGNAAALRSESVAWLAPNIGVILSASPTFRQMLVALPELSADLTMFEDEQKSRVNA